MKLDEKFVFELGERSGLHNTPPKLLVQYIDGGHTFVDMGTVFGEAIQGVTVDGVPVTYDAMYAKLSEYRGEPSTIVITLSGRLVKVEQSHQGT